MCKKKAFTHKKFPYHFKRLVPPTPSSCTDSLIEMFCDRAYVWKKMMYILHQNNMDSVKVFTQQMMHKQMSLDMLYYVPREYNT